MKSSSSGMAIDGFVRKTSTASSPETKKISSNRLSSGAVSAPIRSNLKHTAQNVHKKAQRSQTLMRNIVNKPSRAKQIAQAQPKARSADISPVKASRAKAIPKNSSVKRFGHISSAIKPRAVNPVKLGKFGQKNSNSPTASTTAVATRAKTMPSMVTSASHSHQLERLLDEALLKADAHKKALKSRSFWQRSKSAPRILGMMAGALIVLLVAGFFVWQKVPQVAVKVAATRAHVDASVPSYTPSGFSLADPVKYSSGSVTINFKSASDSTKNFSLTQANSNMDSKTLSSSVVPQSAPVQTSQVNGTTVYIYGSNNAAWVNHGVQYTLKDSANLNSDQVLKIAGSL